MARDLSTEQNLWLKIAKCQNDVYPGSRVKKAPDLGSAKLQNRKAKVTDPQDYQQH